MKKTYYIPTVEITQLGARSLMDSGMATGSGSAHSNPAPPRRDPVF